MRRIRVLVVATILTMSGLAVGMVGPLAVTAACSDNHISLYVNANGGGVGQSFCLESGGNLPNLGAIPGTCVGNTWNDCVSSVKVSLGWTQCFATYSNANYTTLMAKYWGQIGPDTLYNVSPDNSMSSVKQYTKSPATPVGNC